MNTLLPFEKVNRTVFVRQEAETSPKFGCAPESRTTEETIDYGVVNIDKPRGPTSHQVSAYVQKILGINKSGHSGTLDPKVTGVLPVALGRGTKVIQALLNAGKEYVVLMHLHSVVDENKIKDALKQFTGKIKQLPPIKSAVKRQWRYRKIYYVEIIEIEGQDVLFKMGCQAGTYVRKYVHDLGQALGTGAHMQELRRSKAAGFNESTLVTLQDLADAFYFYKQGNDKWLRMIIKPVEYGLQHIPKVWVFDTTVDTLCHGANLKVPGISKVESDIQLDELVAVMTLKGEVVCIGLAKMTSKEMVNKERGLAVETTRVFMEPGVYPKIEKKTTS